MPRFICLFGLMSCIGCAGNQFLQAPGSPLKLKTAADLATRAEPIATANTSSADIRLVDHSVAWDLEQDAQPSASDKQASDDYEKNMELTEFAAQPDYSRTAGNALVYFPTGNGHSAPIKEEALIPLLSNSRSSRSYGSSAGQMSVPTENTVDLNLPSALAMIGGQHPVVGFAQWRVQEAYAQLSRAQVMWLPSIQSGFSFHRHDGNFQASDGSIIDVNRNSFQYGLGVGATGAGTTLRPGLIAQFHMADAIFQPRFAEKTAWARGHAASAVLNEQLLTVATAYIELLDAYQDARILEESLDRTAELSKITLDFAEAGEGLLADANRMETELRLVESRFVGSRERIAVASARLAQALSIEGGRQIQPLDVLAVPIELVNSQSDKASLIGTGLASRPELKESQALVAAACEAYQREKYAPFVPSVLLGFSTGGFGGGLGNSLSNVDDRYDFDALMSWEMRNLGFGERAARRESSARVQQANYQKLQMMDQVAREVSEAYSQVQFRREQISITQRAIEASQASYELNLTRIRDGQGLPLEVLQSVQALETARRAYLRAVIDHNQAQFRLQWALGWPVSAPQLTQQAFVF